jgi:hypothetical protein
MMALGGVATGSMNAYEHEMVAGIINSSGFCSIDTAITGPRRKRDSRVSLCVCVCVCGGACAVFGRGTGQNGEEHAGRG